MHYVYIVHILYALEIWYAIGKCYNESFKIRRKLCFV